MNTKMKKFYFPIIFAIGFIPMIVREHIYSTSYADFPWFPTASQYNTDFFLYYKMAAIIVTGIIMSVILIYQLYHSKHRNKYIGYEWICMLIYSLMVIFSTLFSIYKKASIAGEYEVFEPVWVLLAYVMMCLYCYFFVDTSDSVRFIFRFSAIGYTMITLIGFFQFFGLDLFRSTFGKMLITPISQWNALDTLEFTFAPGTSYATLYNTNFLPLYYGIGIPLITLLIISVKEIRTKIALILLDIISMITLIGSNSKTGFAVMIFIILLALVVMWKSIVRKKCVVFALVVSAIVFISLFITRYGDVKDFLKLYTSGLDYMQQEYLLNNIETNDADVALYFKDGCIHVDYENQAGEFVLHVTDEKGNRLDTYPDKDNPILQRVDSDICGDMVIAPIYLDNEQTILAMQAAIEGNVYYFTKDVLDHTYYMYNFLGKYEKVSYVKRSTLFKRGMFSGRGAIWNNVLPKLKSCLLFGTGPNTFAVAFPNSDYAYKTYENTLGIYDVKAHCYYLQIWLEEGLIALISLLVFYGIYFIKSMKLYWHKKNYDYNSIIGVSIMLGTLAYLMVAMFNDSTVNTAPVFWCMLGIGMAINKINTVKNERDKKI